MVRATSLSHCPQNYLKKIFSVFFIPLFLVLFVFFYSVKSEAASRWTTRYLEAESLIDKENWTAAAEKLLKAIALKDKEGPRIKLYGMRFGYFPHFRLGLCYYRLEKWDSAKTEFETSIKLSKYDESKKYLLLVTEKLKKLEKQEKKLEEQEKKINALKKKEWDEYYAEALDFMNKSEWMKASESIKRSIAIKPPVADKIKLEGREIPYTPRLLLARCYTNLKLDKKIILDELFISFEEEKSRETEDFLLKNFPAVWVNP